MKIAVSILSSSYDEEESIRRVNETDADFLHVDVMDGSFVPYKTREYEHLQACDKPLNVHLMVSRPFDYISKFAGLHAESIDIHSELEDDLVGLLSYIKELGMKCGLVLNPSTPVEKIEEYLHLLDEVLIMTVEPGRGGQELIEETLVKIDQLIELRETHGLKFRINIDGGINDKTIVKISNADIIVSGSFVCKSKDYQEAIDTLRNQK